MCMKTEQDIAAMAEDKAFDELTAKQSTIEVGSIWRHRDYQNKVLVINAESKIECRHPDGEDILIIPRDMFLKVYTLHAPAPVKPTYSHYQMPINDLTVADIYDICEHYCHDNSGATQHAIKKLLRPGKRGHKDELKDLREAVFSINRRIAILERKTNDKLP